MTQRKQGPFKGSLSTSVLCARLFLFSSGITPVGARLKWLLYKAYRAAIYIVPIDTGKV